MVDKLVCFYGPGYFFEVLEEILYSKDLFASKEAESLLSLFESLLVRVSPNLHPVSTILSIIRGFIYFHSSMTISDRLGELVFVSMNIYGKDDFKCFKKDFEIVGCKEIVIDLQKFKPIKDYINADSLSKLSKLSFRDKIIGEVKELTSYFK